MGCRKRPTLALFLDNLFDPYEEQLWRTVVHAAEAEDVNLLCFFAGPARGQRLERTIFDLPGPETVDGIIAVFAALNMGKDGVLPPPAERLGKDANAAGCFAPGELDSFLDRYGRIPVLSVGMEVPGLPSLVVDNQAGMRQVLSHLVEAHGRRRIAFIRGPDLNADAAARFDGYRAALAQHGIPWEPALVCPGDFTDNAGIQAVRTLLDERGVPFDALVAANDTMALHALRELQRRGVRVPEQVAVVGFDDQPEAGAVSPPLTTVAQPLREMALAAVAQVLALIRGEAVPATTRFATRAVTRRSCGCAASAASGGAAPGVEGAYALEREVFVLQHVFRATGVEDDDVTEALGAQLPKLGVGSFYLARLIEPAKVEAVLEYHYSLDDNVALDPSPGTYRARRLLPGRFTDAHRWAYVLMPLHYGAEETGFAVCEIGAMSGIAYESLVNQLGRALKASTLMREVRRYAGQLEERVEERARQLRTAQQQLVEIAHEAGMAEIAVGVLHNVGNLLNSVSVAAEAIGGVLGEHDLGGMARLSQLLESHRGDLAGFFASDPRAALVPAYCRKLAESLEGARAQLRGETRELLSSVMLIRESVATLQEYARYGQDELLADRVDLAVLIEAALKIQAAGIARNGVQVRRRIGEVPPVLAQRFKVIHVLVNLVKNAVEAMQRAAADARVLTVELHRGPAATVVLRVSDTGEGISRENLKRVFSYAFTTKPDGHGFGLHASANYLKQMGGSISAESDGPGRGARFTVTFDAGR